AASTIHRNRATQDQHPPAQHGLVLLLVIRCLFLVPLMPSANPLVVHRNARVPRAGCLHVGRPRRIKAKPPLPVQPLERHLQREPVLMLQPHQETVAGPTHADRLTLSPHHFRACFSSAASSRATASRNSACSTCRRRIAS